MECEVCQHLNLLKDFKQSEDSITLNESDTVSSAAKFYLQFWVVTAGSSFYVENCQRRMMKVYGLSGKQCQVNFQVGDSLRLDWSSEDLTQYLPSRYNTATTIRAPPWMPQRYWFTLNVGSVFIPTDARLQLRQQRLSCTSQLYAWYLLVIWGNLQQP